MQIRVLGCSGGIGDGLRTTSFLVDDDILIDAGTGVGDLTLDEMGSLRHIFITHSHLDHITGVPLLLDTLFGTIDEAVNLYALPATLAVIREHVFNWQIWPDFEELSTTVRPVISFHEMNAGESQMIANRNIEMIKVNHTVPGVAYRIQSETGGVFCFSGDTTTNDSLWDALNAGERLDLFILECAFANHDIEISKLAKHYCPSLLADDLKKLKHKPNIMLTHFKPGEEYKILHECRQSIEGFTVNSLVGGEIFTI